MPKICGVVILYNPPASVLSNINSYYPQLDFLIVVDNSEQKCEQVLQNLANNKNCRYIQDGNNNGIAKRLNIALDIALSLNMTYLLTMDQDSFFESKMFANYLNCLSSIPLNNVAMVGVEYGKKNMLTNNCEYEPTSILITSGSIINLSAIPKVGRFDEQLFIDEVDNNFCYQAIKNNFTLIKLKNIFMEHQLGETAQFRSLKNGKISTRSLHSPQRLYYMVRNYFYITKKYKNKFLVERKLAQKNVLVSIKNNLIYNPKRFKVLYYVCKGYYHFLMRKMGKQV